MFDDKLEQALTETLSFLREEENVSYTLDEGRQMLGRFLELSGPEGRQKFLAITLLMKGQMLLVCSEKNQYYFNKEHPDRPITLTGLSHQWTEHPDQEHCAAKKYRQKELVPGASAMLV